jgi:hypothetical protein
MNALTQRELSLCKSALDFLHSLESGQASELQIHAAILRDPTVHPKPSASEVDGAITILNERRWAVGVPAKFANKMVWNISTAGEAARLEM